MVQLPIELKRGNDDTLIQAYIVDLKLKHVEDFENQWKEILTQFRQSDKFWDWIFKLRYATNNDNIEAYAIEYDNETQGLMQVETQLHGSQIQRGLEQFKMQNRRNTYATLAAPLREQNAKFKRR